MLQAFNFLYKPFAILRQVSRMLEVIIEMLDEKKQEMTSGSWPKRASSLFESSDLLQDASLSSPLMNRCCSI